VYKKVNFGVASLVFYYEVVESVHPANRYVERTVSRGTSRRLCGVVVARAGWGVWNGGVSRVGEDSGRWEGVSCKFRYFFYRLTF
jgi:hypothetical protein